MREAVGGPRAIIAGTGNYNTAESIELSREAASIGVTALLGTVPYYNKPPQEGLYQHFKAIAEAVAVPTHPLQRAEPHGHQHAARDDRSAERDRQRRRHQGGQRQP